MTNLYSLPLSKVRTYGVALAFIVGNVLFPQLCHLVPQGGLTLLPIYFFTLFGAYKYGMKVGLLTAVLSPLVNNLLFAMPAASMLPILLTKSVLLAIIAALVAQHSRRVSLALIAAVVAGYQLVGSLAEWAITGSLQAALQDFTIGIPGLVLQVVGGYLVLKYILKD